MMIKIVTPQTPAENKIVVNDDEGSILLNDQNGNKITMNSDSISIESAKILYWKPPAISKPKEWRLKQMPAVNFLQRKYKGCPRKTVYW